MLITMENQPTFEIASLEATVASGKAFLRKGLRFLQKVRDLNRDPLASYYKFKVCKGLKQPACKWTDPRNHQKAPIDQTYYNTGIPTGPINNLLVVDVDVKDQGMEEFRKYIDSYGSPNTLTISTPSGGLHLYFNYNSKNPQDAEKIKQYLRNKTGFRGKGIDIRSEGGYIIAPHSVVSKKPSKIINNTAVVDIPSSLINWLLEDRKMTSAKKGFRKSRQQFRKTRRGFRKWCFAGQKSIRKRFRRH